MSRHNDRPGMARMDDAAFENFLRMETSSDVKTSTIGIGWRGLHTLSADQGDDAFDCPPLKSLLLVYCEEGFSIGTTSFPLLAGERRFVLKPGKLCFIPAGQAFAMRFNGQVSILHILLQPHVVEAAIAMRRAGAFAQKRAHHPTHDRLGAGFNGFVGRRLGFLDPLITEVQQLTAEEHRRQTNPENNPRPGDAMANVAADVSADVAAGLAADLASAIVDYAYDFPDRDGQQPALTSLHFAIAIDYIETHLTASEDLGAIADYIGVSADRLATGFQKQAGCDIDSFRAERQIGIVQTWLADNPEAQSAEEIAARLGFSDAAALDAVFRGHLGISFANYRAGRFG